MPEFFETKMGRQFFDGTAPQIAKALERIADRLENPPAPPALPEINHAAIAELRARIDSPASKLPTTEEIEVYLSEDCASLSLDDSRDREHAAARIATWLRSR